MSCDNENNNTPRNTFCGRTRREFLWEAGGAFTSVALAGMLSKDGFLAKQAIAADGETDWANPLAPRQPHFAPKAKTVIFLFMYGGPSQVDTFYYKPKLYGLDGKTIKVKDGECTLDQQSFINGRLEGVQVFGSAYFNCPQYYNTYYIL